jgi:hypothetical protein
MLRFIQDRGFLRHCRANSAKMRRVLTTDEAVAMYERDVYHKLLPCADSTQVALPEEAVVE